MSERSAFILCVGSELTEGIIQDTHLRYLSSQLTSMGFSIRGGMEIPDDADIFRQALSQAVGEVDLVIVTGGLGPTSDDLTRDVVAETAGVPLEFHQEAWDALIERFKGGKPSDANRKQAMAPKGFTLIANHNGTAPGFHGEIRSALVVALPGPPGELLPMFSASVEPFLASRFNASRMQRDILWATAMLVPESALEEALRVSRGEGIAWGTRLDDDRIVFSLRGGTTEGREAMLGKLAGFLGAGRIRRGEVRPAQLLMDALKARGESLVTAESCTGGLLGKWMTDISGSSLVYWGGFVTYSNEAKTRLLGIDAGLLEEAGAVSEWTVKAMAAGARQRSAAALGIAVSGIAGPEGGSESRPVGTVWVAVSYKANETIARSFFFTGGRDMIRRRTAVASFLLAEAEMEQKSFS